MYLTGIKQLGVAKSFSAACVQYQLNNLLIIFIKFLLSYFSLKMGVLHLTPTKYSLVAKFLKTDDCVYIVISSVESD